ncbi:MAG TPA: NADH-quinone oxidoreductase subunit M, partial [Vicinamibacterales bacterium]|nr:NADH-quinone oxidoreductase subunit M [Vicinamibacterales bacterium]
MFKAHILSVILFTPLAGAALLLFVKRNQENAIRWIGNVSATLGFVVAVPLWFWYEPMAGTWQLVERARWIPSIGAEYHLGVDGFSVLLILLTTLMGAIAVLSSWTAITERVKEYYIFMLVLQTGMLGALMALDFLLFFLFWEVMLVPMYFLIGIWGGGRRLYSAIKFFIYTLVGSVVMLLGILALYFFNYAATGTYSFDVTLYHQMTVPFDLQKGVFLAFFLGFAVKVPMFPFHTWLPDAHTDAPTAGSVILAAVLLKMGTYGFIRFSLPILPDASRYFVPLIIGLSVIGIVYGALVALAQTDWKRLVAYSSVSHMAMVMLGMFALNPLGVTGSIIQQVNHGISTGALFLIVGIVYERRHTRDIAEYGGLSKVMPVFAAVFMIMTMSSIGLPALNGFIGEFTILVGAFARSWWWAALAVIGIVLGAAYMLWMYQRVFFGPLDNPENAKLQDLDRRALPPGRDHLRAPPHAHDRGVRRHLEADAGVRHLLSDHHHVLDRAAGAQRLRRRVHDPGGRVQPRVVVGGVRGARHRARRRLHAVDVPAGLLRAAREPGEREAPGPRSPRDRIPAADRRPLLLDRPLSEAVLPRAGEVGRARDRQGRSEPGAGSRRGPARSG